MRKQFKRRNFAAAASHISNLVKFADRATFEEDSVNGFNYQGELLMRGSKLNCALREIIIPYTR